MCVQWSGGDGRALGDESARGSVPGVTSDSIRGSPMADARLALAQTTSYGCTRWIRIARAVSRGVCRGWNVGAENRYSLDHRIVRVDGRLCGVRERSAQT